MDYRPGNPPYGDEDLTPYITRELAAIQRAMASPFLSLQMLHKEPAKLQDGMVVLADGTNWNPGSGGGFYGYRASAWRFLG